ALERGEWRRRLVPRYRRRGASLRRRREVARRSVLAADEEFRPAGPACGRRHARHGLGAGALCACLLIFPPPLCGGGAPEGRRWGQERIRGASRASSTAFHAVPLPRFAALRGGGSL